MSLLERRSKFSDNFRFFRLSQSTHDNSDRFMIEEALNQVGADEFFVTEL